MTGRGDRALTCRIVSMAWVEVDTTCLASCLVIRPVLDTAVSMLAVVSRAATLMLWSRRLEWVEMRYMRLVRLARMSLAYLTLSPLSCDSNKSPFISEYICRVQTSSVFCYFVLLVMFQMISGTFVTQLPLHGDVTVILCHAVTGDESKYKVPTEESLKPGLGTHTLVTSLTQ